MLIHLGRESIEGTKSTILSEKRRSQQVIIMMTLMFSAMVKIKVLIILAEMLQ